MKITIRILLDKLLTAYYGNIKIVLPNFFIESKVTRCGLLDDICIKNLGLDMIEQ